MNVSPAPLRAQRPVLRLAYRVATLGGLGDHVLAPGTFAGSLPAAVVYLVTTALLSRIDDLAWITALGVVVATAVGIWASGTEARRRGVEDPGPVVIDEVAGQWLTFLIGLIWFAPARPWDMAAFTVVGFLLFRAFDVVKPWPVRWLERLPGGVGIMIDDLAAAVYAGIVLALIAGQL